MLVQVPAATIVDLHVAGFKSSTMIADLLFVLLGWVNHGRRFRLHIHTLFEMQLPLQDLSNFVEDAEGLGAHVIVLIDGFELIDLHD